MPRKYRRLTVLDMLILIAATAPGLALIRWLPRYETINSDFAVCDQVVKTTSGSEYIGIFWNDTGWNNAFTTAGRSLRDRPSYLLSHLPVWGAPFVACGSIAISWLTLRGERLRLRQSARTPGAVVGLGVLLAILFQTILSARTVALNLRIGMTSEEFGKYAIFVLADFVPLVAVIVGTWWVGLAAAGFWRPEASGAGRIGRIMGYAWIAMAASGEAGRWAFAVNL